MKRLYPYKKIDAFTAGDSLGNPAACLYLEAGQKLSEKEMLSIAQQHKGFVSEVVYCTVSADGIGLRYYSSECEVDFCGHGTVACMHQLIGSTPALLGKKEIDIQTYKKGRLTVYNRIPETDAVLVAAPRPLYLETGVSREAAAKALGLSADGTDDGLPLEVIDAGLRTLIVPLGGAGTLTALFPDEGGLREFCACADVDIVLIFTKEAPAGYAAHTRVFAPKFGYLEDPATGSGNSAFGYYMLKNGLWDGRDCVLYQGGCDRVWNKIFLSCVDGRVLFGGSAALRIDGVYHV